MEKQIKIDIEEIMNEIRNDIKEKGYTDELLSFKDVVNESVDVEVDKFDKVIFNEEIYNLNTRWNVQTYHEIPYQAGLKGKIVKLFKRIVRKIIHFYTDPIIDEQNEFNAITVRTFNLLNQYIAEKELESSIETIKNKEDENSIMLAKIEQLEKELFELKQMINKNGEK